MLLILPALICLGLLVLHSFRFRPVRATEIIFAFMIPASLLYGGESFYVFNVPTISIELIGFRIPLMNIVGFIFTFYCSLTLAVHILRPADGAREIPLFKLVFFAVYIASFIGIAIEYVNLSAGWWSWRIEQTGIDTSPHFVQLFGVWAWRPTLIFPVLLQFFIVRDPRSRRRVKVASIAYMTVFFLWMVFVDRIPVMRYLTIVVFFIVVPYLGYRLGGPMVSLDALQWDHPVMFLPRWRERRRKAALADVGKSRWVK